MPTPEEIPPFKSNFSPDEASHWLKTLVAATGSFSDSGIFRLLSTKFEDDAPATKWYDELEDTIKQSWPAFKREFHITWISTPRRIKVAENEDAWNKFCDHKLTYDTIFIHDYPNFDHCRGVVHTWVEEHLRLGEEIKSGDVDLVRKTLTLLPTFIQASLETKYDYEKRLPADLRELCGQLQEMGPKLYKLEWLRRQKSLKETLEDEIRDIARKVDSIMNILDRQQLGRGVSSVVEPHPTTRSEANETVAWEPCSPLTSVISVDELSNVNRSQELDTPTAEQCPLPDAVEGSSFVAPLHWRVIEMFLIKSYLFIDYPRRNQETCLKRKIVLRSRTGHLTLSWILNRLLLEIRHL
ncbi:hypothetical protein FRC03_011624 [Tulasnella sp. 419]|nr:hypothetical protein FRC03_011624 [Tulasnella sp. 419]